jgi:hypothetical protein
VVVKEDEGFLSEAFTAVDLVFGAALSAFLGVSLATESFSPAEIVGVMLGLGCLSFAILLSRRSVSDLLRSKVNWLQVGAGSFAFLSAGSTLWTATRADNIVVFIILSWFLMFAIFGIVASIVARANK